MSYMHNNPYLAHHGIKGMKWGVKNGPPYPLDASVAKKVRSHRISREERRKNGRSTGSIRKAFGKSMPTRREKLASADKKAAGSRERTVNKKQMTKRTKVILASIGATAVGVAAWKLKGEPAVYNMINSTLGDQSAKDFFAGPFWATLSRTTTGVRFTGGIGRR